MFRLRVAVASTARRCHLRTISGEILHTFPFSIQPELISDYRKFEMSLVEAIAEDMEVRPPNPNLTESVADLDRITEAARSLRRVRRALERVEKRRAKGENVGLLTSLYPTRDLPGGTIAAELEAETDSWIVTPGFPPNVP